MKIIEPGHVYELDTMDGDGKPVILPFVNREAGCEHEGTQTQEVMRALIDRTKHCDNCRRWGYNDKIIYHMRMIIALHEARALERGAEKGLYDAEFIAVDRSDGHFQLIEENFCADVPKGGLSDAEIYHRKDRGPEAEGKPAQFTKMLGNAVGAAK